MKIKLHDDISVRDLVTGYVDDAEEGVFGYGGKLNIRPPYQREFIYDDKKRNAVIETINGGYPLNVMYWVKNEDSSFELLDGQQRTVSICQYVNGEFSFNGKYFHNLQQDEKDIILDYRLMIYWCEGHPSEVLDWFKIINIGSLELTPQELRNAIYHGPWVTDSKRHFSKTGCPAYLLGKDYMAGKPLRQEFLETVIKWISGNKIESYMAEQQHEVSANDLWLYFQKVIAWVKATFPNYSKQMKGQPWGVFYRVHGKQNLNPELLEKEIAALMMDDEVSNKKGVYAYVLSGDERHLNLRAFSESQKCEAYEGQKGVCANKKDCPKKGERLDIKEMHADHITPWSKGGKTQTDNCQLLCAACNRRKSDI